MKKVLFLALGLMLMVSCSNEAESSKTDTTLQPKSGTASLKDLYNNMIQSESHTKYKDAITAFMDKTNYYGPLAGIDSETKLLNWINNNITSTDFTSYNEAESEWSSVKTLSLAAVEDNFSFYEALEGQTPGQIFDIVNPSDTPPSPKDCPECQAAFLQDMATISSQFSNTVSNAISLYFLGLKSVGTLNSDLKTARQVFDVLSNAAQEEFINCCIGA